MSFASVLTLIFIILKLVGTITWPWWVVLSPVLIEIVLGFMVIIGLITVNNIANKEK